MPGIKKHPWHSFFSKLEQPKCPILKEWLGKLWSVSAMEYCAAIKCVSQRMCCSKEKNLCNEKWKKAKQKIILCFNLLNLCACITTKLREGQGVGWGSQIRVGTLRNTDIYGIFKEGVPSKGPEKMNQRTQEKAWTQRAGGHRSWETMACPRCQVFYIHYDMSPHPKWKVLL